jgi:hypothetical protein
MKNKMTQIVVGIFFGFLMLIVGAQTRVFGQQSFNLVGVWQAVVTPRNCQTGDPSGPVFQGLFTFHEGGTMAEDSAGFPPPLRVSGHGIWAANNMFHPTFAYTFFRFNADGTLAGSNITRQNATFNVNGNEFTSNATVEVRAANGNLITTVCLTSTATRFQ